MVHPDDRTSRPPRAQPLTGDRGGPGWLAWLGRLEPYEPALYAAFAAACTLVTAHWFLESMLFQTSLTADPTRGSSVNEYSAPLDDVFIHFDFARSAARGFPFHWSESNGYSSGGTSLLYPLVLAPGYWAGLRGSNLMIWALTVAAISVLGLLLAARRLFEGLPRWTSYLAPPTLLCLGALNWTLWSGMEVALFLGWSGAAFRTWLALVDANDARSRRLAVWLGSWGALLAATRPEAVTTVAVLSLSAAVIGLRRHGRKTAFLTLVAAALPGALVVIAQTIANKIFTGEFSAAGALAKLEMNHPYLTAAEKWEAWKLNVGYQIVRVTHYHMSKIPGFGWIVWLFAALALVFRATRRAALLLWGVAAAWIFMVALNGQVRWQNERYAMPAVAWLLLAAALGMGALLSGQYARARAYRSVRWAGAVACLLGTATFVWQQLPRFREQIWFYGRASRNIRDQHVVTGRFLRQLSPPPRRVLVGDAGAISYVSDLPALDIIGLGGYHDLPFARATRFGVEAALELIERLPRAERPDVLAIYPSWWGNLPLWFGRRLAEFPVFGNVICGGPSKVIYAADWSPFEGSAQPFDLSAQEQVVDELDLADLVNEKQHDYRFFEPARGYMQMKLLHHPRRPGRTLWDAARIIPAGAKQQFVLRGARADRPARLIVRAAPAMGTKLHVSLEERRIGTIELAPGDAWREYSLPLPATELTDELELSFTSEPEEHSVFHVWLVQ